MICEQRNNVDKFVKIWRKGCRERKKIEPGSSDKRLNFCSVLVGDIRIINLIKYIIQESLQILDEWYRIQKILGKRLTGWEAREERSLRGGVGREVATITGQA